MCRRPLRIPGLHFLRQVQSQQGPRGSVCDVVECDATLEANVSFSGQICDEEPEPGRAAVFNADPPRDDAAGQPQETDPLATVTADGVLRVLADMLTVRMASP